MANKLESIKNLNRDAPHKTPPTTLVIQGAMLTEINSFDSFMRQFIPFHFAFI